MRAGRRLVVLLAVAVAVLAGCRAPEPPTGLLARVADLRGASYVVAGGMTDELTILCQLTAAALQAAGAEATEQCGKIGVVDVPGARDYSEVDTGWAYLSRDDGASGRPVRDPNAPGGPWVPFDVRARDDAARGTTWLAPTAFSDADAVVVSPATAASGIRTLSDLAARGASAPVTLCATPDAVADPRRLAGVRAAYGFPAGTPVRALDAGAVLAEVVRGGCTAGEVPGTSGRIPALGLTALADDRGAFGRRADGRPGPGRGGAAPIVRSEVVARHPQVAAVMREVTTRLTDDAIRELDRAVGVDGRDPRDVARRWLAAQGLTP